MTATTIIPQETNPISVQNSTLPSNAVPIAMNRTIITKAKKLLFELDEPRMSPPSFHFTKTSAETLVEFVNWLNLSPAL